MPLLILPSKNNIDSIPHGTIKPDLLQGLWKLEAVAEKKQLAVQLYVMKTGKSDTITKSSSSSTTEKLEKSKENEENLPKEPQDEEGAPEENDLPSTTEGKKKRKRKRKSSISNESGNFYKRFIFVFTRKGNGFLRT